VFLAATSDKNKPLGDSVFGCFDSKSDIFKKFFFKGQTRIIVKFSNSDL
jgi:hypothetical protein